MKKNPEIFLEEFCFKRLPISFDFGAFLTESTKLSYEMDMEQLIYPFAHLKERYEKLTQWRDSGFLAHQGILIGSDRRQEVFIPWWWRHYEEKSRLPVAFADFGMTKSMRQWCQCRGEVIDVDVPIYLLKNRISKLLPSKRDYKHKLRRLCFFKKPFAFLKSPFRKTLWLDTDCKIMGDIEPIFSYADHPHNISLALMSPEKHVEKIERGGILPGQYAYNSGVMPYNYGAKTITNWARATVCLEGNYYGDQDILTKIINEDQITFPPLLPKYNWIVKERGFNPKATILHYSGMDFVQGVDGEIDFLEYRRW